VPSDPPDQQLAHAIRELREDRELTQEDLAYHAGVRTGTVSQVELGQSNPSWTTVRRLARALEVSLPELGALVEAGEAERAG
jgi:transcriptional regulator with XRE-family HTH domain